LDPTKFENITLPCVITQSHNDVIVEKYNEGVIRISNNQTREKRREKNTHDMHTNPCTPRGVERKKMPKKKRTL
jgi:hypothetical protein